MSNAVTYYTAANLPSQNMAVAGGTEQVVLDSRGNVLSLVFPGNGSLDGVPFRIIVSGHCVQKTAGNLTMRLYFGSSPTIASNAIVANSNAHAISTGQPNMIWHIDLVASSQNLPPPAGLGPEMCGFHQGIIGASVITLTTCSVVTGINPAQDSNNQSSARQSFSLTTTLATFSAGDAFFVDTFELRAG